MIISVTSGVPFSSHLWSNFTVARTSAKSLRVRECEEALPDFRLRIHPFIVSRRRVEFRGIGIEIKPILLYLIHLCVDIYIYMIELFSWRFDDPNFKKIKKIKKYILSDKFLCNFGFLSFWSSKSELHRNSNFHLEFRLKLNLRISNPILII